MKILELFSGTESFSKVAKARGHEVFTVDNNPQFNPSLCIDIMELTPEIILEKFGHPDIIWASPPCTTFSVASIRHYWADGKPKNKKALKGIKIVKQTIKLIKEISPRFYIIENPRGMLRKQDFMQELHRDTVTYCQYGAKIMKPTDLWNNLDHKFKPCCKPGSSCHERASRSSKKGNTRIIKNNFFNTTSATERGIVPELLCKEILEVCENKSKEKK